MADNLNKQVGKFLEVYRYMPAEAKGLFESQIIESNKKLDPKTQKLYNALLKAAKLGLSPKQAIAEMSKAAQAG